MEAKWQTKRWIREQATIYCPGFTFPNPPETLLRIIQNNGRCHQGQPLLLSLANHEKPGLTQEVNTPRAGDLTGIYEPVESRGLGQKAVEGATWGLIYAGPGAVMDLAYQDVTRTPGPL